MPFRTPTPNELLFTRHKNKVIDTYATWKLTWYAHRDSLIESRTCVEQLLKAIITYKYHAIVAFDGDAFKYIKAQLPQCNFRDNFQAGDCLKIVFDANFISDTDQKEYTVINYQGNDFTHGPYSIEELDGHVVHANLQKALHWFFTQFLKSDEQNPNWERDLIEPALEKAEQLLRLRKKEHNEDVIVLNSAYWIALRKKSVGDQKAIYEKFILEAQENDTHRFVALEARDNKDAYKQLLHREYRVKRVLDQEQLSFGVLFKEAQSQVEKVLIKIHGKSGEGKTVLLSKLAHVLSHDDSLQILYIRSVTDLAIESLQEKISRATKPVYVFIDTPSQYETGLINKWKIIYDAIIPFPVVVIIADQKARYQRVLCSIDVVRNFDRFFHQSFEVEFLPAESETAALFNLVEAVIQARKPGLKIPSIKRLFQLQKHLTAREKVFEIISKYKIDIDWTHRFDWETFGGITSRPEFSRFSELFKFVAIFSRFGIPVPISLFDYGYFPGINGSQVYSFLTRSQDIILLQDEKLQLRHEHVSRWYFNDIEHQQEAIATFKSFLRTFTILYDHDGCYLLRNISRVLLTKFGSEKVPANEIMQALETYSKRTVLTKQTKENILKTLMTLVSLEGDADQQLEWLDQIIRIEKKDFHARTKKMAILLELGDREACGEVLSEIKQIGYYDTYILAQELILHNGKKSVLDIADELREWPDHQGILWDIALWCVSLDRYDLAVDIYERTAFARETILLKMFRAKYYFRMEKLDKASNELQEILLLDAADIPASLLLFEILFSEGKCNEAETVLDNARLANLGCSASAIYVSLAKLYRSKIYEIQHGQTVAYLKSKNLFDGRHEIPELMHSMQFRTEYAKWCYERHEDSKEMHLEAISILEGTLREIESNHIHSITELGLIYKRKIVYDLDKSTEILIRGFEVDFMENHVPFRVVLASNLILKGETEGLEEARKILDKAARIDPTESSIYKGQMFLYAKTGKVQLYEQAHKNYLKLASVSAKTVNSIATNYLNHGRKDLAWACVEEKLKQEPTNYFLLNLSATILFEQTRDTPGYESNEMLDLAVDRLLKSNDEDPQNPITLHLLIVVYDLYLYEDVKDDAHWKNKIKMRNKAILELKQMDSANPYLLTLLTKMFRRSRRSRVALAIIATFNLQECPLPLKLCLLRMQKVIYADFNDIESVKSIMAEISSLQRAGAVNAIGGYDQISPSYLNSRSVLKNIWNEGQFQKKANSIRSSKGMTRLTDGFNAYNKLKDGDRVFFCSYGVYSHTYADNIEPHFEKTAIYDRLMDFLPDNLCMIHRRRRIL